MIGKFFSLIFTALFLSLNLSFAQQQPNNFWQQVRFGGGIGLSFGDGFFSGSLSPSAIYDLNPYASLGIGLSGTYNSQKDFYKSTILGGSLIGLFNPVNGVQISAEFEELRVNRKYESLLNVENDSYWLPALYLGAGYRTGNVTFGVRFDVLHDKDKSIYADAWAPFVRFYF
ncbi:MAG: alpha-ketoglutarate decarboxylase [Flavobacteriaceae bacterium]